MGTLAPGEECVFWLLQYPMCHRLDNSLSSPPFTVISTCSREKEYEIKHRNVYVCSCPRLERKHLLNKI